MNKFILMTALFIIANAQIRQQRLIRNRPILGAVPSCGNATPAGNEDDSSDFPKDLFNRQERRYGAIVLHLVCTLYCFIVIAFVCNDYFLPSVDCICQDLNLSKDVAGATFMAFATSAPELFVNVIGTFLTESDLGVGTVVGSAVCNSLGVTACGGLAAIKAIRLHRWPLVRDCVIYMVVVAVLTGILWDERVDWYEALALLLLYVIYCCLLFGQRRIFKTAKSVVKKASSRKSAKIWTDVDKRSGPVESYRKKEDRPEKKSSISKPPPIETISQTVDVEKTRSEVDDEEEDDVEGPTNLWALPNRSEVGLPRTVWWLASWPVAFCLHYTVPDLRKNRCIYPLTFLMCIVWIAISSYLVSWMMTVLGETFGISDSVMGLTLVAIGGSMPEASSSVINAKKGIGSMTISNALGGNTLDILLSLGLPWFIKTQLPESMHGGPVRIESHGLVYNNAAQLACVAALFIAAAANRFQMDRKLGAVCLVLYLLFIVFIVAIELNLFNLDTRPPPSWCS